MNAKSMERGIAKETTSPALKLPSNSKRIAITRKPPSSEISSDCVDGPIDKVRAVVKTRNLNPGRQCLLNICQAVLHTICNHQRVFADQHHGNP